MKIKNYTHIGKNSKGASKGSSAGGSESSSASQDLGSSDSASSSDLGDVSIGGGLGQLQQTLGTAKAYEGQRAAVIQQAMMDIREGKLGTDEDFEQAVSALLQEL